MSGDRVMTTDDTCVSYGCGGVGFLVASMGPLSIWMLSRPMGWVGTLLLIWGLTFATVGGTLLFIAFCKFTHTGETSFLIRSETQNTRHSEGNNTQHRTGNRSPAHTSPNRSPAHQNNSRFDPPSYHDQVTQPEETTGGSIVRNDEFVPGLSPDGSSDAPPSYLPPTTPPPPSYQDVLKGGFFYISPGHSLTHISEQQETNTD